MPWLQDPKLAILKAAPACCASKSMMRCICARQPLIFNRSGNSIWLFVRLAVCLSQSAILPVEWRDTFLANNQP